MKVLAASEARWGQDLNEEPRARIGELLSLPEGVCESIARFGVVCVLVVASCLLHCSFHHMVAASHSGVFLTD